MSSFQTKSLYPFLSLFLICNLTRVESTSKNGFTVDLIHRDSLLPPFQRLAASIERSFTRNLYFSSAMESPVTSAKGEYLMRISIGTPPTEQLGIADTGSDLTWMQCKPCTQCYKQRVGLFDPRRSTTYKNLPCDSAMCAAVGRDASSCGDDGECRFEMVYGDNSYSSGDLSADTLTFGNSSFSGVVFGCSHETSGTFIDVGSGIVGLGGGPLSVVRQLNASIGGRFSYCLTSLTSNSTSKISFGADAAVGGPTAATTPMVSVFPDTFYHLILKGISVGNERLSYMAKNSSCAAANVIIDSGTTLTFLEASFVDDLESAVVKAVKGKRISESEMKLNVCYEKPKMGRLRTPPLMAHFEGADIVLPEEGVFVEVEEGVVCLMFQRTADTAIFGNLLQMNYEVGFDLVKQEVSFLPADCSKSN